MKQTVFEVGKQIVQTLVSNGFEAYFAGGWVRDFLLNLPSEDLDIATSASPEQVIALFDKTICVGQAFGSIVVVLENHCFEVSTFRQDLDYKDGRHPSSVQFCTAKEDALRRDFTINGMFYDPLKDQILDFVQGQEDLKKKQIKAIGEPKQRFEEDRLRMLRALRFSLKFGFTIDPKTYEAIQTFASQLRPSVSVERIWQELVKMVYLDPLKTLNLLFDTTLYSSIFSSPFPSLNEAKKLVRLWNIFPKIDLIVLLHQLLKSLSLQVQLDALNEFKVSNRQKRLLEKLVFWETHSLESDFDYVLFLADPDYDYLVQNTLIHLTKVSSQDWLCHLKVKEKSLSPHIKRMRENKTLITGPFLLKEGISPGPKMGLLIQKGEEIAVNHNLLDTKDVITLLKKTSFWKD